MGALVSVGIPTYNRPEGLRNTLKCITNQTYKNLQIIVADNCSDNSAVKQVVKEFADTDPRIVYYCHDENKGPGFNFRFLLEIASGDFFMWAADDDNWAPEFVEELLSIIGNHSGAFCNYAVQYHGSDKVDHIKIVKTARGKDRYEQAKNFLQLRIPSMIYGLFKTKDIRWIVDSKALFDWFDCFAIFKLILIYNGFVFSEKELYYAGVKGETYEYKPMNPSNGKTFTYSPYFFHSAKVIFRSDLGIAKKIKLLHYLTEIVFQSFITIEKNRKTYPIFHFIYRIYCQIKPTF